MATNDNLQTPGAEHEADIVHQVYQETNHNSSSSTNRENIHDIFEKEESNEIGGNKLNLPRLLQHFAVYTNQKQDAMTYLLKLLKTHEPAPCYSFLPSTGKELLKIDGYDWPSTKEAASSKLLPSAVAVSGGKYFHFGVKTALCGESPGLIYSDADLLQFVDIYLDDPTILPKPIQKRVCVLTLL